MKKNLLLAVLLIHLLPIIYSDDYSSVSAQNMTFENGSWLLPDLEVNGKEKEKCDQCGEYYDADDYANHECMVTCEYCNEKVSTNRYEYHMETMHPNLFDKTRCVWCQELLTKEEYMEHDCRNFTVVGQGGGSGNGSNGNGPTIIGNGGNSGGNTIWNSGNNENNGSDNNSDRVIINSDKIDSKTLAFLRSLRKGGGKIVITSSKRAVESQAKAVLDNIIKRGVKYQKNVYKGRPGERLCDAYNSNFTYEENLRSFINIINSSPDPSIFSHHLGGYDWRCTFDISQSNLSNPKDLYTELLELRKNNPNILKVFFENGCIHIEYKIK